MNEKLYIRLITQLVFICLFMSYLGITNYYLTQRVDTLEGQVQFVNKVNK